MKYASQTDIILYFICSITGIIIAMLLILGHLSRKALRKPPGLLIVWELIAILIIQCLILSLACYNVTDDDISEPTCITFAMLWTYAWFIGAFYLFCLSYEINRRVTDPLDMTYSKRSSIYHGVSQIIPIVITLIGLGVDAYGKNHYDTCFIKRGSAFGNVLFIPGIISIGSLILNIKSLRTMDTESRYLWRYVLFCLYYVSMTFYGIVMATVMAIVDGNHQCEQAYIFVLSIGYTVLLTWRIIEIVWLKDYFAKRYNIADRKSVPLISNSP